MPMDELVGHHVQGRIEYQEKGKLQVIEVNGRLDALGPAPGYGDHHKLMVCVGDLEDTERGGAIYFVPDAATTTILLDDRGVC